MLVPHHGSRTSSSAEFIAAVAPRWAVVTAGYRSRFGHPSGEVLARYRAAGVRVMRTDLDGAVHVLLEMHGPRVIGERQARRRYWRQVPPV
jgi:competence protein ComEC